MAGTLAEKVWDAHLVRRAKVEPDLHYIHLHLLHEVHSPQRNAGVPRAGGQMHPPARTRALDARQHP